MANKTHSNSRSDAVQKPAETAKCRFCGREYEIAPRRSSQFYCSDNCRKRAWDRKQIIGILIEALNRLIAELQ